jgi:hypothetical protein
MGCSYRTAIIVLAVAWCAGPAVAADDPRHAVFIQPAATSLGASASALGSPTLWVPVGMTFPVSEELLTVEVTPFVFSSPQKKLFDYWKAGWMAAISWHNPSKASMKGFFFAPKLVSSVWNDRFNDVVASSYEVGLMLDVGYQFNFDNVYVAPVLGLGGSICIDCRPSEATEMRYFSEANAWHSWTALTLAANLNLLRVGASF